MSRQYLKELQERAQKLLEVSSDEDQDIHAYTAPHTRSRSPRRIDLEHIIDLRQSDSDLSEAGHSHNTDVQLLKKCISLTNQNNNLKSMIQKQQDQNQHLQSIIDQHRRTETDLRKIIEKKIDNIQSTNKQEAFMKQLGQIQREIADLKIEKGLVKKQYGELQLQKEEFQRQRQLFIKEKSSSDGKKQVSFHNDHTIKTSKNEKGQLEDQLQLQEYKGRIKRLQEVIREQRSKVSKLCHFINAQLPKQRDKIVELTTKLDLRVSSYLLRDVNS